MRGGLGKACNALVLVLSMGSPLYKTALRHTLNNLYIFCNSFKCSKCFLFFKKSPTTGSQEFRGEFDLLF